MKTNALVAGVGMTTFGRHMGRNLKSLAGEAILQALKDAGISPGELEAAYMGNAAAAVITGQMCVPGEIVLREVGIGGIPVVNVENACATGSTAFNQAVAMVTAGAYDVVLACGYEKLVHEDKAKSFSVFAGAADVELQAELEATVNARMKAAGMTVTEGGQRSVFMDIYAMMTADHMQKYGTTREQIAAVSAKNSFHGSMNPRAQFRDVVTVEQVLAAREIAYPLTLPMCSPIGDGAAAVVVVSERKARELGLSKPVRVLSSAFKTGWDFAEGESEASVFEATIAQAYEEAGVGPSDLSVVELHDASAPSEIIHTEYLGLCPKGEGGLLVESGATRLGGRIPVSTSGGLLRKGHPIGATGIAQIVELTEQLQGRSGARQVESARIGLAENGGGFVKDSVAALIVTILAV
ncbi:thiolase family protein [Candidatus Thalassolituus haligoni]|uniref:thiolase family protein n=1 Tax=Candidatus Thalassolituus haligoni TaxID=3100113 RepID=UPI00351645F0|tara:strand:- start:37222 stop:38451 length:1230 start_codon:yes stop_codon:yes gene_type:complete